MVTQQTVPDIEVLTKGLRTITKTDFSWRGHEVQEGETIRDILNQIMDIFRNGEWDSKETETQLHRLLLGLRGQINQDINPRTAMEAKAISKMRLTIDHRLDFMLKIVKKFRKFFDDSEAVNELTWKLNDLKESNLVFLDRNEQFKEDWEGEEGEQLAWERDRARRQDVLFQRRARRAASRPDSRMVILITQSLLGNAYEVTDLKGNKILENNLSPEESELVQIILNKNFRNASRETIRDIASQAVGLIIKGFKRRIPDHINVQINELEEALTIY